MSAESIQPEFTYDDSIELFYDNYTGTYSRSVCGKNLTVMLEIPEVLLKRIQEVAIVKNEEAQTLILDSLNFYLLNSK